MFAEKKAGYRRVFLIHITPFFFISELSRFLKNVMLWAVVWSPVWLLMCVSEWWQTAGTRSPAGERSRTYNHF